MTKLFFTKSTVIILINIHKKIYFIKIKKIMDWEIREIEKYYLTKKDPKNLYQNIKNMTPAELKEIVK